MWINVGSISWMEYELFSVTRHNNRQATTNRRNGRATIFVKLFIAFSMCITLAVEINVNDTHAQLKKSFKCVVLCMKWVYSICMWAAHVMCVSTTNQLPIHSTASAFGSRRRQQCHPLILSGLFFPFFRSIVIHIHVQHVECDSEDRRRERQYRVIEIYITTDRLKRRALMMWCLNAFCGCYGGCIHSCHTIIIKWER